MTSTITTSAVPHTRVAQGLRVIADMFDRGDMPQTHTPEQAWRLLYLASTPAAVRELAARVGVDVDEHVAKTGATHTSFEYPIGQGSGGYAPVYQGAVVLAVAHVSEVSR
jgi:hypothetical protein